MGGDELKNITRGSVFANQPLNKGLAFKMNSANANKKTLAF
ncbi:hypothetical protein HPHPA5_1543 [Helicobacter pylori Hp A-5]|nr:hypothetical protein HPHPA5_1543 [Helicobacter pylori Hp A-5]